MFDAARQTLDKGQAYISIPTQQKVLEKVHVFSLGVALFSTLLE